MVIRWRVYRDKQCRTAGAPGAKREAEIEALRAVIIKAELARAQAENHLLGQRILDLETALAHRQSAAKSAQLQANERSCPSQGRE